MKQQVEVTLKLSLWLNADMDEDEIVTHVRSSLPNALGEELTSMQNPVDILEVRRGAEINGETAGDPQSLKLTSRQASYIADYVNEELDRGHTITTETILNALDAYQGGAACAGTEAA